MFEVPNPRRGTALTLFLGGDVMLGRGVDQILPNPGNPALYETMVRDARTYVDLAVRENGHIPQPVDWSWPWGDALQLLTAADCDARIINLETSITTSDDYARGKAVHYRMNPANLPALAASAPDICVLANNHVLDFGRSGLLETLDVLSEAGLRTAGAGRSLREAQAPAIVPISRTGGRLLIFALGSPSSGIPYGWAAADDRPGVNVVNTLSDAAADELSRRVQQVRRPGDVTVISVHWGSNWGYQVDSQQVHFAHRLIDGGVDLVHGHSSHHPRPLEVYRQKLILYGCGDLVDDYEGISGHRQYRDDLRLLYFPRLDPTTGELAELRMAPLRARQMRLNRAPEGDVRWLCKTLNKASRRFGSRIDLGPNGLLSLRILS
ncbi:MAG TPA: CapA family protein [Propionibacteriaceae bacterium]|nr:CapA family protein [Propionibacteriaceae bacterium]